ncbi:MAG: TonB-dependent receptor, partial [Bacteroidota bacterium]
EEFEGEDPIEIIKQGNTLGIGNIAYGSFGWQPTGPWRADLGLRLHHYSLTGQVYFEPRLTASYQISEPWHLKAGYGHNHQFFGEIIQLDLNQVSASTPIWVLADGDDFDVSRAREATLGAIGKTSDWTFDIEAYYKTISNLPALNLLPGDDMEEPNFDPGRARTLGLDVLVKKRWKNFRSWVIYSISKSDWQFDEISTGFFPANNDRRHQFKWVTTYEANGWLASLGWRYNSGVPNIPISDFTGQFDPMAYNTINVASDHRLVLSLFYQWEHQQAKGLHGKVGFSLLNIYNRENPLRSSYRIIDGDFFGEDIIEETPRFGLGFTPNVSFSIGWR